MPPVTNQLQETKMAKLWIFTDNWFGRSWKCSSLIPAVNRSHKIFVYILMRWQYIPSTTLTKFYFKIDKISILKLTCSIAFYAYAWKNKHTLFVLCFLIPNKCLSNTIQFQKIIQVKELLCKLFCSWKGAVHKPDHMALKNINVIGILIKCFNQYASFEALVCFHHF